MSATARTVDLSNVKEGGNFNKKRVKAGEYEAIIKKVEDAKAKDDIFQYLFTIQLVKHPSAVYPYYCKLQDNQLWKLRNILVAAGKTVPKSKIKVDPNSIVGKKIGVLMEDAEWEGKEQSEIDGVFPAADLADAEDDEVLDDEDETEDEEDEAPEDEEAEFEDEEEEAPVLDREALKKAIKAIDPEYPIYKSTTDEALAEALEKLQSADEEMEEDEDEEPEEEAPPVRKAVAKKPVAKAKAKITVSDDELDELDIDDL
jgi:hypothetical protein